MTSISQPIGAAVTSDVLPQAKTELPSSLDDALKSLHRALNDNKKAIPALMDSIQRLKDRADSQPPLAKALVYDTIATMYETLDMDSCITYYRIGEEAARIGGDSILAQRMRLHIFADMPVTGVVLEGYNGFMDESSRIYPQNRMAYFEAGNKMMLYIADLYARIPLRHDYEMRSIAYSDSLISMLPPRSPLLILLTAQKSELLGDNTAAMAGYVELVAHLPIESHIFARAATRAGDFYYRTGQNNTAAYFYALGALSDARNQVLEGVALIRLSRALYDLDKISQSYDLMTAGLGQSLESGSAVRSIEAFQAVPHIIEAYTRSDNRKLSWMTVLAACLVIALTSLLLILAKRRHDLKKLELLKSRLATANETKENGLARFMELTSLFADKFDELIRLAGRKITAGQIEDLQTLIKGGSLRSEQDKMFATLFDNAFLTVYPDFITQANSLMKPDSHLPIPEGGKLNPELRILAFLRMGITDSHRMARFLGVSINTIYTYRNRLKTRAINRDTFESDLMTIGAIN
ncbi:MAG: hypothetical protein K1V76_03320 [Candidatus Amulumruptor sp.]